MHGWRIQGQAVANNPDEPQRRHYRVAWLIPPVGDKLCLTGRPASPLSDEQLAAVSAQLEQFGGQAWLYAVVSACGALSTPALANNLYVFGPADELVVQLPGFDMLGDRGHGGVAPRREQRGMGKESGKDWSAEVAA